MAKLKINCIVLFLFFTIALVAISSCAKPECRTSSDCASRTCTLSKCEGKKCIYTLQRNCCGNKINESIENGKPGNKCTCPQDYGKCEGKGKIIFGSRAEDAAFVHYFCNVKNQCVLGVEKKDLASQNFLEPFIAGFFKASSVIRFNKPFDVEKDVFEFKISLDDAHKDLVLPIKFTKLKIFYSSSAARSELLIVEKSLEDLLNGITDQTTISTPLTLAYKPQELEEQGSLRYSVDYVYKKQVSTGKTINGTNIYTNETVRATFSAPAKPIFFVRNG